MLRRIMTTCFYIQEQKFETYEENLKAFIIHFNPNTLHGYINECYEPIGFSKLLESFRTVNFNGNKNIDLKNLKIDICRQIILKSGKCVNIDVNILNKLHEDRIINVDDDIFQHFCFQIRLSDSLISLSSTSLGKYLLKDFICSTINSHSTDTGPLYLSDTYHFLKNKQGPLEISPEQISETSLQQVSDPSAHQVSDPHSVQDFVYKRSELYKNIRHFENNITTYKMIGYNTNYKIDIDTLNTDEAKNDMIMDKMMIVLTIKCRNNYLIYPDVIKKISSIFYLVDNISFNSFDGDYLYNINNLNSMDKIKFFNNMTVNLKIPSFYLLRNKITEQNISIKLKLDEVIDLNGYLVLYEKYDHTSTNDYNNTDEQLINDKTIIETQIEQIQYDTSIVNNTQITEKILQFNFKIKDILIMAHSEDEQIVLESATIYFNKIKLCTIDSHLSSFIYKNIKGLELNPNSFYYNFGFDNNGYLDMKYPLKLVIKHKKFNGRMKYYSTNNNIVRYQQSMCGLLNFL